VKAQVLTLFLPELDWKVRDRFSLGLVQLAQGFGFLGLEDWGVSVRGVQSLGVAQEFHDLRPPSTTGLPLRLYLKDASAAKDLKRKLEAAFTDIAIQGPSLVKATDWVSRWKKYYRPQLIRGQGTSLEVRPSWLRPKAKYSVAIEPGQAFGTGTHPTTKLCIKLFLEVSQDLPLKAKVMDFGAGTGVLALAAKRLRKDLRVLQVEVDKEARKNAQKNLKLNKVKMRLVERVPSVASFDLVFANVLLPVLLKEGKALSKSLAPQGVILFSGLLKKQSRDFKREMQRHLKFCKEVGEGDWVAQIWQKSL
jgi:ribosomal protein L11 methylase PrmA